MKKLTVAWSLWIMMGMIVLTQCNSSTSTSGSNAGETAYDRGEKLVKQQCYSCHNPNIPEESRIGPSLVAIQSYYRQGNPSEEAFIRDLTAFVQHPQSERSKMPHAVKQFGLMPSMGLSDEQLHAIGKYLYHSDSSRVVGRKYPEGESVEPDPLTFYQKKGMELALATKAVLGKNLIQALQEHGSEGALEFCGERAIPLTDSMQVALGAFIKRVSDQNRNPENTANEDELAYIQRAKKQLAAGNEIAPFVQDYRTKLVGYYPILTNSMCLQCHGDPQTDIQPVTLALINERYPNDLATGYQAGELRGIWVVEMDR